jgi:hypothetical protein
MSTDLTRRRFYALLFTPVTEYDELCSKGCPGESFACDRRRVGEGFSHNLLLHEARHETLEMSDRRRGRSALMGEDRGENLEASPKKTRNDATEAAALVFYRSLTT